MPCIRRCRKGLRRGRAHAHLGCAAAPPAVRSAPYWMGIVPRYTYRRLTRLPTSADELRRHTVLNLPGMLAGLSFERSEEHTSELQSLAYLVCRLLLEKKKTKRTYRRARANVG